jgi:perosamine synthetase
MSQKIFYVKPSIGPREIELALEASEQGWGSNSNKYIEIFEEVFSNKVGSGFAVATSSCTGALELGLAALDIGPGDEVILAEANWVATLAPIVHTGATPIFVDILEDSLCLDPIRVRESITGKTKAIIVTHLYGNLAEINALLSIAQEFGLHLIEDAAEAIGSYYHGRHAGTLGTFGVFSFHGSKTITTGEGGILVTDNPILNARVRQLNNHGRSSTETRQFVPAEIGHKFKMSNLQAAIGIAQVERFDELVARKREILATYELLLGDLPEIKLNVKQPECVSGAWMPYATFSRESGVTREMLVEAFTNANIDARVFFWPLSTLNLVNSKNKNFEIADSVARRSINLPSYHDMTHVDIERVANILRSFSL